MGLGKTIEMIAFLAGLKISNLRSHVTRLADLQFLSCLDTYICIIRFKAQPVYGYIISSAPMPESQWLNW